MGALEVVLGGMAALTGALGMVWAALTEKIKSAEQACEDDRRLLRALVLRVNQLDRRKVNDV